MLIEVRGQFRRKLEMPLPETADQYFWHGPVKQAIRLGRAVPSRSQITDFILDLRHQHGLLIGIFLAHMMHQGRKCASVALSILR
jgi:hypothetical protein